MNIALVDDHLLLTESLSNLLSRMPEVESVSIYNSTESFIQSKPQNVADLIITDIMMSGVNGIQLLDYCRENMDENIKIIVFSSAYDSQTVRNVIRRGANGFLTKSTTIAELKDAIIQIHNGKQYIGKSVRESLINSVFSDEQAVFQLSQREKDVLQSICQGKTIKEIADDLKLSSHTVQYYQRKIMKKFQVKRTMDMIVYAIKHGYYVPELRQS
ncbi:DNA-binding NarL/FixJ family response regulator [Dyadobacter jejuensis]|uniref:DNA-binding NarL/FixJ family response regulator n=1 Tax=Dyadobacter jejuensis TaxID=1082580 RepID=A0A316AKS0_9BACT|nr:response regulator transcription factor [Dyadobacter jejuensis]PWJ58385.1 DNA-binding NarL/FixJ family response regulator [Dyadobacter jejuensis]